jgi:hypothetical protein
MYSINKMALNNATVANATAANATAHQVFRYKLSEDILQLITYFAKKHQYDDRHSYKEAWNDQWLNDHSELIEREISRLQQLGYKGDVIDKMFKAGRYYFREKKVVEDSEDSEDREDIEDRENNKIKKENKEKKERQYIVMHPDILKAMDAHLFSIMKQANFKPANAYKQFCEEQMPLIKVEIARLLEAKTSLDAEQMSEKIKKTYKNRYYIMSQHMKSLD